MSGARDIVDETCSCGARYYYQGYVHSPNVIDWRMSHRHVEPAPVVRPLVRLPRLRLSVRRMPTVPRRSSPDSIPTEG